MGPWVPWAHIGGISKNLCFCDYKSLLTVTRALRGVRILKNEHPFQYK